MWLIWISGLILGGVSSLHCLGMCGPLALALPVGNMTRARQRGALFLYHGGRVMTYVGMGLLFSWLGRHIRLAGMQQWLSILLGGLLLFYAVGYWAGKFSWWGKGGGWISGGFRQLQGWMYRLWNRPSLPNFAWMGVANGLLPCGMVYLALAGALSMSRMMEGVVFMLAFGLGTLPALLLVSALRHRIPPSFRGQVRRAMPVLIAVMAVWLILRGMNLGIPFVSPYLGGGGGTAISCH